MDEQRIFEKLDSVESRSGQILVELAKLQEQIKPIADHENRIRNLEHWRWAYTGLVALATTFVTAWGNVGAK